MQFRRRPWLTLLGCVAASAGFAQQAHAQQAVAAASDDPVPTSTPAEWPGPPVNLSGTVAYDLRVNHAPGEARTLQHLVTVGVGAASYIYQPWLATVSGTLGLTMSSAQLTSEANATKDRFITGTARMDLFPRSRFPVDIHYERSDSRIDSSGLAPSTLDFMSQNIGISQRYRSALGGYSLSSSFDRRLQEGANFRDTQNLLVGDFTTGWKHHDLSLGLSQSQARRQTTGEQALFRSLVARHSYAPLSGLSLNTTVNWSQNEDRTLGLASDVSVLQWSTVGLWHREGSKLTLSGGARGLMLREAESDQALDSLSLTLGASYELTRNARLTATGTASMLQSKGTRSQALGGSLGASWQGDTIEVFDFRYNWYVNGTLGGSGAGGNSQSSLGLQIGHSVNRSWAMTEESTLMLDAAQSISATQERSSESEIKIEGETGAAPNSSRMLLHAVGATWMSSGSSRNAYARASYNDSRELGGSRSRFQLLNFQVSGTFDFDRYRSLSGDLTLQRVRQSAGNFNESRQNGPGNPALSLGGEQLGSQVASGEITYRQQRLFGVPRLRFVSRLKLARDVLSQSGTLATIPDRETRLWENRLEWVVGRLETQLVFRISEFDGVRRESLMWRVQRGFGG